MKKIIRQHGTWEYVPKADRNLPTEEQTTFVLKPLTQLERMEMWDSSSWIEHDEAGRSVIRRRSFELAREVCLSHISEVKNFPAREPLHDPGDASTVIGYGAADHSEEWPKDEAQRIKYLEQMDDFVILELGNEIRDHSSLTEPEKN